MDYFQNTELSPASKALYNSRLRALAYLAKTNDFASLFSNPRTTIIMIRNHLKAQDAYTSQGLNSFVKSLMAYRKYHPNEFPNSEANHTVWNVMLHSTNEKANEYRQNGEPSPTQQAKEGSKLTLEKIEAIRDSLPDDDIRKLLIAFYTMIPPMRADYGEVKLYSFGEEPETANFIFIDDNKAVMNISDYKTAQTNGPVRQVLHSKLHKLLLASRKTNPRPYLFGPYSGIRFSVWANKQLTDLFGVKFTLVLFRHIYLNSLPINRMTVEEKQKTAHLMGQSFNANQQDLYRWM